MEVEPPQLMEEIVEEILLRFPPQEPDSLVRAALVCKAWSHIVSDRGFRSRFCKLHRTPPMLGFLCNHTRWSDAARFVPTTAFSLPHAGRPDRAEWHALDARHGRVILKQDSREENIVVWDPITDMEKKLPIPRQTAVDWTAAVLCATRGDCDHLDCHFLVVFACTDDDGTFIYTYSSEADMWSEPISGQQPDQCHVYSSPSVLVGNAIYFGIPSSPTALKYNLELQEMSWIQLPSVCSSWRCSVLTTTEEGGLGLLTIGKSKLYMWLREGTPEVDAEWTQNKVIDLKVLLPVKNIYSLHVLGFADGVGIVFLSLNSVIYTLDLKTSKMEVLRLNVVRSTIDLNTNKVKEEDNIGTIETIVPYMSFYTPALKAASTGVGPSAGGS